MTRILVKQGPGTRPNDKAMQASAHYPATCLTRGLLWVVRSEGQLLWRATTGGQSPLGGAAKRPQAPQLKMSNQRHSCFAKDREGNRTASLQPQDSLTGTACMLLLITGAVTML